MLTSLTVKQFALIDKAQLELEPGMTVFTGETGAGKSMLVDALGAAFGARASSDWVRHGAERAEVVAVWDGEDDRINALLSDQDIELEDELILKRVIGRDGRSRAYINATPVPLKTLQKLGQICLDLHGQHEHQMLMKPGFQCSLLDERVNDAVRHEVEEAFKQWRQIVRRMETLQSERGETEQKAAWMRDEFARLQALEVEEGLGEQLQAEVEAGRHHAQIQQAAAEALMLLDEAEPSARQLVARAGHAVETASSYHDGLKRAGEMIEQIDVLMGELEPELHAVLDESFDPQLLRQHEERLMQLHEAMRRHGTDEGGLLQLMREWEERLSALDTAGWDEASLAKALSEAEGRFSQAAETLTAARVACGKELAEALRPFMDRLSLASMEIRFDVRPDGSKSSWSAAGWDSVSMQVMSNPGEPWRELGSVASGGELSRLVLALKGCGALARMPHIAVFDEVDTGIGGETAWCVGELLALMGNDRQVLVISHLPQVASCADQQVVISKRERDGRTLTSLNPVLDDQRMQEIARMLGGVDNDSRRHAETMLGRGSMVRSQ
ncbi:DNA replication and repair protein RecN [Mariprofundus ferrinatatus]|uniref:DNA repair protein RecN n=1 Tax=Mariprofundus ferrinatatus TaxID=1921087 RepID=A0A2K8L9F2_9PROT|nr:DNA repair protein RecN [Mariprofundus ferrinatatus]ATX81564.1 DNA replication and repair protein RecN [Mariprofundus ferrinatatus]